LDHLPHVGGDTLDPGDIFILVPLPKKPSPTVRLLEGNPFLLARVHPTFDPLMIDLAANADAFEDPE
jgi:hypothetical protein